MSNVVSISGDKPPQLGEPNEAVVAALEELLAMAKGGQLQNFIGTGFAPDGGRVSCWAGEHQNVYEMLGSINWLEHEYVDRITGNVDE